mgnify:CR=1 FL=1
MFSPDFDPVAFSIGPLAVRWYGLMYLVGFAMFLILGRIRARQAWRGMSAAELEDLLFYGVVGVIAGGDWPSFTKHGVGFALGAKSVNPDVTVKSAVLRDTNTNGL